MNRILPFLRPSPEPVETTVAYLRRPGGVATAIHRRFAPGGAAACRLCPPARCCAVRDACLLIVGSLVPEEEAHRFSTLEADWQDDPEGGGR